MTGPDHSLVYSHEPTRNVFTSLENIVGPATVSKYDYTVNRIGQRSSRAQSGSAFSASSTDAFTYNGVGERTGADNNLNNALDRTFAYDGIGNRTSAFDANGNLSEVSNDAGVVAAHDEYDPFVSPTTATGAYAGNNVYRFSTRYADKSGFLYYCYRFYNPALGRWINRDPIEEEGGLNLYGFVDNNSENRIDYLGLSFLENFMSSLLDRDIYNHWISGTNRNFYTSASRLTSEGGFSLNQVRLDQIPAAKELIKEACRCRKVDVNIFVFKKTGYSMINDMAFTVAGEIVSSDHKNWKFEGNVYAGSDRFDADPVLKKGPDNKLKNLATVGLAVAGVTNPFVNWFNVVFNGKLEHNHVGVCPE